MLAECLTNTGYIQQWAPIKEYPVKSGYPVSVYAEGRIYQLLNICYENLYHLLNERIVEFPLEIQEYSKSYANVVDSRVPKEFLIPKD